jgi:hypothetical protein
VGKTTNQIVGNKFPKCSSIHSILQKSSVVEGADVMCSESKHTKCKARHKLLCGIIPQQHENNIILFKIKFH